MISISNLQEELRELIVTEENPGKLIQVISLLKEPNRKDILQVHNMQGYIEAGGNCGLLFQRLDECMIYSPKVLKTVIGKSTYSSYHKVTNKAKLRIKGESTDITRQNNYFKLGSVLSVLYDQGKLPFRDEQGQPVPVTSHHCLIDEPAIKIRQLISELG